MRIYEFSKQYNIPIKDIISALQVAGFTIKSHMSVIDDQAIDFLKKSIKTSQESSKKNTNSDNMQQPDIVKNNEKKEKIVTRHEGRNGERKEEKIEEKIRLQITTKEERLKSEAEKLKAEAAPLGIVVKEMSVADLAQKLSISVGDLIITLLKMGIVAEKNKFLSENTIRALAKHYNFEPLAPQVSDVSSISHEFLEKAKNSSDSIDRLPIVVILGHVDHGKTTLLDFIRKTRVAMKEKGGITQHIGAYEAKTEQGNIVFLDTPGHEAFSKMRKRGVRIADIVVLIIAADDGVMPQTVEAIKHAISMQVPIIVAINKMDKVDKSRIDVIKRELAQHGITPEEWGGDVVCIPISAKTGNGVSELLEMIALQAQLMELKAIDTGLAKGFVLESGVEKGYGQVATIISQQGVIHLGDYFIAGNAMGKVISIVDSHGNSLREAKPSMPVRIAGFELLPNVGDSFEVVVKNEYLARRSKKEIFQSSAYTGIKKEGSPTFIIKTDTNSSKEALLDSIAQLSRKENVGLNIASAMVGGITESDVQLASNIGANIIGLHVKVEPNASLLAHHEGITIYLYDIIYKLLENLELLTKKAVAVKKVLTRVGQATVLRVFDIKNIGIIAGSYVKEGRFVIGGHVNVLRKNKKIGEGIIKSLQREKKSVKEVNAGFECGFVVDGFNDWLPDDQVECLIEVAEKSPAKKTISS